MLNSVMLALITRFYSLFKRFCLLKTTCNGYTKLSSATTAVGISSKDGARAPLP